MSGSAGARATESRLRAWFSVTLSAGCLGLALSQLEPGQLRAPSPPWLVLGLGCSQLSLLLAALRWRSVAQRLGLEVSCRGALSEVVAASLVNQLLPLGVAGELFRVSQHARRTVQDGASDVGVPRALRAVALDRLFGQASLWLCALPTAALWLKGPSRAWLLVSLGACGLGAAVLGLGRVAWLVALRTEARSVLRAGGAIPVLGYSLLVVLACVGLFACSSRALGMELGIGELWRIAPAVLLAMAVPVSLGGLGVREASSAALYTAAGLSASSGSAVGALYGILTLLGSLPGAWLLRHLTGSINATRPASARTSANATVPVERRPRA